MRSLRCISPERERQKVGKEIEEGGLTDGAFYHGKAKTKYKLSFLYTLQLCI